MIPDPVPNSDAAEGERRNQRAHDLLEARRAAFVNRGRRALLLRLLEVDTGTADDAHSAARYLREFPLRAPEAVPA